MSFLVALGNKGLEKERIEGKWVAKMLSCDMMIMMRVTVEAIKMKEYIWETGLTDVEK